MLLYKKIVAHDFRYDPRTLIYAEWKESDLNNRTIRQYPILYYSYLKGYMLRLCETAIIRLQVSENVNRNHIAVAIYPTVKT